MLQPNGRVAQWESARFTRERSLVRNQPRPWLDQAVFSRPGPLSNPPNSGFLPHSALGIRRLETDLLLSQERQGTLVLDRPQPILVLDPHAARARPASRRSARIRLFPGPRPEASHQVRELPRVGLSRLPPRPPRACRRPAEREALPRRTRAEGHRGASPLVSRPPPVTASGSQQPRAGPRDHRHRPRSPKRAPAGRTLLFRAPRRLPRGPPRVVRVARRRRWLAPRSPPAPESRTG
jgi:hypothetical protein